MNTHHGDTEARRNIGLLCEALTESIIGAAIEVHDTLGRDCLSQFMKNVGVRNFDFEIFRS